MIRRKGIIVALILLVSGFLVFGILKYRELKSAVEISDSSFPDSILREAVKSQFDSDQNGVLSLQEIRQAKKLVVTDKKTRSRAINLDGLQYLSHLTQIKVHAHLIDVGNSLWGTKQLEELELDGNLVGRKLDISQNSKLQVLVSNNNFIEKLDLGSIKSIRKIDVAVSGNQAIRLSDLDELEQVSIYAYGVPEIEIRNCHKAKSAKIIGDQSKFPVDVSIQNCKQLQNLYIEGAWIRNIDLDKLERLVTLDIKDAASLKSCQLGALPRLWNLCIESALTLEKLFFHHAPELKIVKLAEIKELPNLDFSNVPKLRELEIHGSGNDKLTHIEWGNKEKIGKLDIRGFSKLGSLDLTGMTHVESLSMGGLAKAKLKVGEHPELKTVHLELAEENLDCLDLSGALNLERMEISGGVREIELGKNEALKEVTLLELKNLKGIDFANTPNIQKIEFEDLSKLQVDLSPLKMLKSVCVSGNKAMDQLDLQELENLETFEWISGKLKKIDWGEKYNLTSITINDNCLEGTLSLDNFKSLRSVDCKNNRLSKIIIRKGDIDDASANGFMLNCENNYLKVIDLQDTFIGELFCERNPNVKIYLSRDITNLERDDLRMDKSAKIIQTRDKK